MPPITGNPVIYQANVRPFRFCEIIPVVIFYTPPMHFLFGGCPSVLQTAVIVSCMYYFLTTLPPGTTGRSYCLHSGLPALIII
jgi:hypothetical protein